MRKIWEKFWDGREVDSWARWGKDAGVNPELSEVKYGGRVFRTRIEARWAVFFDSLGVEYWAEPWGYSIGGGWYIPDFYLPDLEVFVEVRFERGREVKVDLDEAVGLCEETKKGVLTVMGEPLLPDHSSYLTGELSRYTEWIGGSGEAGTDIDYWFCTCPRCDQVGLEWEGYADRIDCGCEYRSDKGYNYDSVQLLKAYEAAEMEEFSGST